MPTQVPTSPTLFTKRLELRKLNLSDAPEIFIQRSDDRILQHLSITRAASQADALAFIQKIAESTKSGESAYWAICPKGENKLVGTICLYNFQPENAIAEVGYSLHPDHWGKGYASEALSAVLDFGFNTVGAVILEAHVQPENAASIRLLEKAGFVRTGTEEAHAVYSLCQPPIGAVRLETERLRLREVTPADAPFLLELLNSPGWLANIGDRKVYTLEEASNYLIYKVFAPSRRSGFGFYLMERRADGARIGNCGLIKRDYLEEVDIGYAILPQFYGQGYTTEAAEAILQHAKHELKLPRLLAITIGSNKASHRVLEKIGLRFERKFFAPGDAEELMLWELEFGNK